MHMKTKMAFPIVLAVLIAAGVLASVGTRDNSVTLASAGEVWGDILRDADQVGLQFTRMSDADEMHIGSELATSIRTWAPEDAKDSQYVTDVAASLLPHIRRKGIHYQFHVIESPAVNAFALPGGHVYVMRGMMDVLLSEAELAAVIGHEMSHVDLRHCAERYQYENAFAKAGAHSMGVAVGLARSIVAAGYSQYQELEADADGTRLAIEAGYDPDAGQAVFTRLEKLMGETRPPRATTPAGELAQAMDEAVMGYFRTHPTSEERIKRLAALYASNHRRLQAKAFYAGVQNYSVRVPRTQKEFPGEKRVVR
jgi:predicted Zn-dependent protease